MNQSPSYFNTLHNVAGKIYDSVKFHTWQADLIPTKLKYREEFVKAYVDHAANNTFSFTYIGGLPAISIANHSRLIMNDDGTLDVVTGITSLTNVPYEDYEGRNHINLNPFSIVAVSRSIKHGLSVFDVDREPMVSTLYNNDERRKYANKLNYMAMRSEKSLRNTAKFTYVQSMIQFRKYLNKPVLSIMNKAGLYDYTVYNTLIKLSEPFLERVKQFVTLYPSYPYTTNTFRFICEGQNIHSVVTLDRLQTHYSTSIKSRINDVIQLFKCSRLLTGVHTPLANLVHASDDTAISNWIDLGIYPKNWMDKVVYNWITAYDLEPMIVPNSPYDMHQLGFKEFYKTMLSSLGYKSHKDKGFIDIAKWHNSSV